MADQTAPRRKRGVRPKLSPKFTSRLKREAAAKKAAEEAAQQAVRDVENKTAKPVPLAQFAHIRREPLYNYPLPDGLDAWPSKRLLELNCFRDDWNPQLGGLGAYQHFRNYCSHTYPELEWNPWLENQIRSLTDDEGRHQIGRAWYRFVSWTGCGSAGKTFAAGLFATVWFWADPLRSSVTLTSTSKIIIGQRIWPVIQHFHYGARDPLTGERLSLGGNLINSRKMLEATKGDEKHSICAVAVEGGELQESIDRIKGRHCPRMLVIIDEANTTPPAIFESITNIVKGAEEVTVLVIGNAVSHLDNHGRCCEPKRGWTSITVEDEGWETKGVPEWSMLPGICRHYDGSKSPNVKAHRTIFNHIYSYEDHLTDKLLGVDSVMYWSQSRGFWPPEGICNTVFSEMMIDRFDGRGRLQFITWKEQLAFMDSAFGGDNCVIQIAEMGDLHNGRIGIQLTEHIIVRPSVVSKHEIDYQIAHALIDCCQQRKILPQFVGLDATGTGRGAAAIVMSEWSDEVQYIEWGGAASELPAGEEHSVRGDPRPAHDVYANRVAELWYSCRGFLRAGQLRGLYHEAIIEFTTRTYEHRGRKIHLETKEKMRERLRRSPDRADAISGIIEIARRHGAVPGVTTDVNPTDPAKDSGESFNGSDTDSIYTESDLATTEMDW